MIFQKSVLGVQEILSSNRSLGVRQRQVLVLVDGKRSAGDLEGFFEKQKLSEILNTLEQLGFIQHLNATLPTPNKNHTANILPDSANVLSQDQINAIKQILINGADDYLGLMGRSLKEKIQNAVGFEQLKTCISLWQMAMRESKLGRESASFLMEQINQTIENKTLSESTLISQMSH
jgi:hypothetical protein